MPFGRMRNFSLPGLPWHSLGGIRDIACVAIITIAVACAPTASLRTAHWATTPVVDAPKGTLLIVGGGSQPPELVRHFVDLAGGPGKARIAILPMATSDAVATGAEKKAELDSLGADSFVVNVTRAQADDDSVVRKLSTATGISRRLGHSSFVAPPGSTYYPRTGEATLPSR